MARLNDKSSLLCSSGTTRDFVEWSEVLETMNTWLNQEAQGLVWKRSSQPVSREGRAPMATRFFTIFSK